MNILMLSIGKINEINEQGIYTDLLKQFIDQGHNVCVVSPREKREKLPTELRVYENWKLLKVKIGNITKTNMVEKGISTLKIESLYVKAIKKHFADVNFDLVLYATPPITFDKVIKYIKKRDNATSYLMLKDIFPQNAIDLKILSKFNPLYYYFRRKEKSLYKNADYIGCMSQANVDYIIKNNTYLANAKIEICPNTITPVYFNISKEDKMIIRSKYNIPNDKTIYIYGGNLGKPQGITFIIETIKINEKNKDSFFLIIGSGTEYKRLESFLDDMKLKNTKLLKQLPKSDYDILVRTCDVGLIFLDYRFTIPNLPSRLLSYLQASIPVLAATDPSTDLGDIIEDNNFGYWCESNDASIFNEYVRKLNDKDLRSTSGKHGKLFLENNYTSQHAYKTIMKHFK